METKLRDDSNGLSRLGFTGPPGHESRAFFEGFSIDRRIDVSDADCTALDICPWKYRSRSRHNRSLSMASFAWTPTADTASNQPRAAIASGRTDVPTMTRTRTACIKRWAIGRVGDRVVFTGQSECRFVR